MQPVSRKIYANAGNPAVLALVPRDCRRVLDIGCGAGDNARRLKALGMEVDGITLSEDEAEQARQHCRRVWVHNLETGLPPGLPADYDCCIASHVLEHICWPQRLLEDARDQLALAKGVLVVAIPNLLFVRNRLRLLAGNFEYTDSGLMDNTHFRWYTFRTMPALLEANGLKVELACVDGGLPLGVFRRILPAPFMLFCDRLSCRWWPGLFGYQMLFLARGADNMAGGTRS